MPEAARSTDHSGSTAGTIIASTVRTGKRGKKGDSNLFLKKTRDSQHIFSVGLPRDHGTKKKGTVTYLAYLTSLGRGEGKKVTVPFFLSPLPHPPEAGGWWSTAAGRLTLKTLATAPAS